MNCRQFIEDLHKLNLKMFIVRHPNIIFRIMPNSPIFISIELQGLLDSDGNITLSGETFYLMFKDTFNNEVKITPKLVTKLLMKQS